MARSFKFFIILFLTTSLSACLGQQNSVSNDSKSYSTTPNFAGESALYGRANAVFRNNCVSCHSEFGTYTETQWQSAGYLVAGKPNQSLVFQMIAGSGVGNGKMPLGGHLSASDISTLGAWISQVSPVQTTAPGTLSAAQRTSAALQVIQSSCISCHGDPNHLQTVTPTGQLGTIWASGATGGSVIGAFYSGGGTAAVNSFGNAQVAEVLLYQQVLNSSDRLTVECYLANKFALPITENCGALLQPLAPSTVSGLQLWLNNNSIGTLGLSNGAAIATWTDSSGNGFDHQGAGSTFGGMSPSMPTFIASALNGLPAAQVSGGGYFNNGALSPVFDDALTGIIVYKSLSPSVGGEQDVWDFGFQNNRLFGFGVTGGLFDFFAKGQVGVNSPDGGSVLTTSADTNWHIHTSSYSATGVFTAYLDGPISPTRAVYAGAHSGQSVPAFASFTNDSQFAQAGLVVPQDPNSSWIFQALKNFGSMGLMPQGSPALTATQAQTLNTWITQMGTP